MGSSQQFRECVCGGGRYSTPTLSKTNVEVVLSVIRSTSTAENARASVRGGELPC